MLSPSSVTVCYPEENASEGKRSHVLRTTVAPPYTDDVIRMRRADEAKGRKGGRADGPVAKHRPLPLSQ